MYGDELKFIIIIITIIIIIIIILIIGGESGKTRQRTRCNEINSLISA